MIRAIDELMNDEDETESTHQHQQQLDHSNSSSAAASAATQSRDWPPTPPAGCLSIVMRTPPSIIAAPKENTRTTQSATAMRISGILLKCTALESVRQQLSNRATPMPSSASFMHTEHQSGYTVWRLRWMNHEHVKSFCETIASVGRQCPISISFEQQKLVAIVTPYRLDLITNVRECSNI